jgi:DNA-binding Lrp family transcriptional regulator
VIRALFGKELTFSELMETTGLSSVGLTKCLRRMLASGLVVRSRSEVPHRKAGKRKGSWRVYRLNEKNVLGALSEETLDMLLASFSRAAEMARSYRLTLVLKDPALVQERQKVEAKIDEMYQVYRKKRKMFYQLYSSNKEGKIDKEWAELLRREMEFRHFVLRFTGRDRINNVEQPSRAEL